MSARAEQPMGETPSTFHPSFNAGVVIEARVERLTSDAGAVIVREVMERSGIIEWLTERLHDPRQPHLVTYPLADLLRTMLLLFAQGWRDQDDADALRLDPALRLAAAGTRSTTPLAEGARLASQPTLSRLLDILTLEPNRPVLREAVGELAARRLRAERGGHKLRYLTIDVDGLPVEVHGAQPGSAWNGHYHQRMYHPISACAAETGDLLDARCGPATRTPPKARSTSPSTWLTAWKAPCARLRRCVWTPASPKSGCSPGSSGVARLMSPGCATTALSIGWPGPTSSARRDGHRPSRGCGCTSWSTRPAPGRVRAGACWWSRSARTTCCLTTSGC